MTKIQKAIINTRVGGLNKRFPKLGEMTKIQKAIINTLQAGPLDPVTLFARAGNGVSYESFNRNLGQLMDQGVIRNATVNDRILLSLASEDNPEVPLGGA